jgi:hypothetical protein
MLAVGTVLRECDLFKRVRDQNQEVNNAGTRLMIVPAANITVHANIPCGIISKRRAMWAGLTCEQPRPLDTTFRFDFFLT